MFAYDWENRGLKNVGYLSANLVLLVSTVAVAVVLPCRLMPPTPHSLVTVVNKENWIFIGEAISFDEVSGDERFTCRYGECENNGQTKPRNLKLLEMMNDDGVQQKNRIFTFANMSKYSEVSLYHPESRQLKKVIQEAECGVCINDTNLCSKLTRYIKTCTCTTGRYLYVGPGFEDSGKNKVELFDLSSPSLFKFSVSMEASGNPIIGSYAAVKTERGILQCGGKTANKYSAITNQCYLLSEHEGWKMEPPMHERRSYFSMVQRMPVIWVAGGQDSSGS